MSVYFASHALRLSAGLLLCVSATSDAAEFNKVETRGKVIPQDKCGRCHAIEAVGESPLNKAPPMRDIYARFNPRELQAESSLRARFLSTRRCPRSTSPTKTCTRFFPTSMHRLHQSRSAQHAAYSTNAFVIWNIFEEGTS